MKIELSVSVFRSLIDAVDHARSTDETRKEMQGILLVADKDELVAIATDGHRLAIESTSSGATIHEPGELLLSREGVLAARKFASLGRRRPRTLLLSGIGELTLDRQKTVALQTLPARDYPNWKMVTDRVQLAKCVLSLDSKGETLETLERIAKAVSPSWHQGVELRPTAGKSLMLKHESQTGAVRARVEAEIALFEAPEGEPVNVGLHAGYLADAIRSLSGGVRIGITDEISAVVIRGPGLESLRMVMPMRLELEPTTYKRGRGRRKGK